MSFQKPDWCGDAPRLSAAVLEVAKDGEKVCGVAGFSCRCGCIFTKCAYFFLRPAAQPVPHITALSAFARD
jgi:hypothetical protein